MDTTKVKGNVTEMESMLAFMKHGYNVLTPYGDSERYDYVVDANGRFYKIQSKSATGVDDGFYITCKTNSISGGKNVIRYYTQDEIDYYATTYDGECYLIPFEVAGKSSFKLRISPTKNKQESGVNWADNYKMEEVIKNW